MVATTALRALALYLSLKGAQAMPKYELDIPEAEAAALAAIVEDDPANDLQRRSLANDLQRRSPLSPAYTLFQAPLSIPPVKEPLFTVTNPYNGGEIDYYEIEIKHFSEQVFPDLGPADLVGYDGISPGPTFIQEKGRESVVRFVNKATVESSIHLHGSFSRAPWDGWAEDVTNPGEYKDYYYPNAQAGRFSWYHDHAMHETAENAYNGQAGGYIIHDPAEDSLGLPSGYGEYDIPLILTSKQYNSDGTLFSTKGETQSLWGDVIQVNGVPWPYFDVEPRKYRFRLLDAAVSRSFSLYFVDTADEDTRIPFQVIASDSGLLEEPVTTSKLVLSIAERYEIILDFSDFEGKTIELRNEPAVGGLGIEVNYDDTDKVMRFNVAEGPLSSPDTSVVPSTLRDVPFPSSTSTTIDHSFRFARTAGQWSINGVTFSDVENRLLANVPLGTVQLWQLTNAAQGWTHPIHIHLVDFKILSRTGAATGATTRGVEPYESAGLKDVVYLGKGETVVVEAHYAPWPGVYMFHCHNLIHEDNDMMAAFNVTVLPDYGYNSTALADPMQDEFRAKPYVDNDVEVRENAFSTDEIEAQVQLMASYQPYDNPDWEVV